MKTFAEQDPTDRAPEPDERPPLRLDLIETADVRGEVVRLRPARPDEAHLVHGWTVDPGVAPFWGGLVYADFAAFSNDYGPHFFAGPDPSRGRMLMVEALEPAEGGSVGGPPMGLPIGIIALNEIAVHDRSVEIDMLIGPAAFRGRGYGTDALRALLRFLFEEVGLHRVWLATYADNARARRAYEKAGFTLEGILRKSDWVDGRWVDSAVYGVLAGEHGAGR